ncbi:hypothetical protein [Collinsella aerofaciens]
MTFFLFGITLLGVVNRRYNVL